MIGELDNGYKEVDISMIFVMDIFPLCISGALKRYLFEKINPNRSSIVMGKMILDKLP